MKLILRKVELKHIKYMISAIKSSSTGAASVIKKWQPIAEYTNCRNHIINLTTSFTSKNESVIKFSDNLNSICLFFEHFPKRQKFFYYFIEYY